MLENTSKLYWIIDNEVFVFQQNFQFFSDTIWFLRKFSKFECENSNLEEFVYIIIKEMSKKKYVFQLHSTYGTIEKIEK